MCRKSLVSLWCERGDSNPHRLPYWILSPFPSCFMVSYSVRVSMINLDIKRVSYYTESNEFVPFFISPAYIVLTRTFKRGHHETNKDGYTRPAFF